MKNILLITAAVSLAVLQGCAGRTATKEETSAAQHAAEKGHVHDHPEGTPCPSDTAHGADESHGLEGHTHGTPDTGAENPDEIVFPAEQAARTDFEVQEVKRGPFRETLRCGGEIYASQSELSVVSAPIAGVVTSWTDAS